MPNLSQFVSQAEADRGGRHYRLFRQKTGKKPLFDGTNPKALQPGDGPQNQSPG
jgi:hypothetical protein